MREIYKKEYPKVYNTVNDYGVDPYQEYEDFIAELTEFFDHVVKCPGFKWEYGGAKGEITVSSDAEPPKVIKHNQIVVIDTSKVGADSVEGYWFGQFKKKFLSKNDLIKKSLSEASNDDLMDELKSRLVRRD